MENDPTQGFACLPPWTSSLWKKFETATNHGNCSCWTQKPKKLYCHHKVPSFINTVNFAGLSQNAWIKLLQSITSHRVKDVIAVISGHPQPKETSYAIQSRDRNSLKSDSCFHTGWCYLTFCTYLKYFISKVSLCVTQKIIIWKCILFQNLKKDIAFFKETPGLFFPTCTRICKLPMVMQTWSSRAHLLPCSSATAEQHPSAGCWPCRKECWKSS